METRVLSTVTKYYIKRREDGAYYSARPGQYYGDADSEARWSKDIGKARLYSREAFARRTITDLPLKDGVEILTVTFTQHESK